MKNVIFVYDQGITNPTSHLLAICGSSNKADDVTSKRLVDLFPMPEGLNLWEQEEIDNKRLDYKKMNIDYVPMTVDFIDF